MDFRKELAQYGYNKGNSIDVETLISEILPEMFSQKASPLEKLAQDYLSSVADGKRTTGYADEDFTNGFKAGTKLQAEQLLKFFRDQDNHTEGELGNSCIDVASLIYFIEHL